MRLTRRDGVATLAVVAAVAIYALWVGGVAFTGVSVRVIAAVVFGIGWVGCTSDASEMASVYRVDAAAHVPLAYSVVATLVGIVALVAGIVAIVGANEVMLATLVTTMVVLWLMATVRHALPARMHEPVHLGRPLDQAA